MKIVVYHTGYGCETGCCGHAIAIDPTDTQIDLGTYEAARNTFDFRHADDSTPEELRRFAENVLRRHVGAEHIKDLDWEHCVISDGENC